MTLNIGQQLLEDAKLVREGLNDFGETLELEAIDRIIQYFQERYLPPSEPGSYKETRGILAWYEGSEPPYPNEPEPAEVSIRRIRDEG